MDPTSYSRRLTNSHFVDMQDVVVVHHAPYTKGVKNAYNLAIFAVADGHNGDAAAQHIQNMLCSEIKRHLPSSPPPIAPGTDGQHF